MKINLTCFSVFILTEKKQPDFCPLIVTWTLSVGINVLCMAYPLMRPYLSARFNEVCYATFLNNSQDIF